MANVTLYVPDDLWKEYEDRRLDPEVAKGPSRLFQEALRREIKRLDRVAQKEAGNLTEAEAVQIDKIVAALEAEQRGDKETDRG